MPNETTTKTGPATLLLSLVPSDHQPRDCGECGDDGPGRRLSVGGSLPLCSACALVATENWVADQPQS